MPALSKVSGPVPELVTVIVWRAVAVPTIVTGKEMLGGESVIFGTGAGETVALRGMVTVPGWRLASKNDPE